MMISRTKNKTKTNQTNTHCPVVSSELRALYAELKGLFNAVYGFFLTVKVFTKIASDPVKVRLSTS